MRSADEVIDEIFDRFVEVKVAQVGSYVPFEFIEREADAVWVKRVAGEDTKISRKRMLKAISAVRADQRVYHERKLLVKAGVSHVTSPVFALLHLVPLEDIIR